MMNEFLKRLAAVNEVAAEQLATARPEREPPSLVEAANAAVRWLSPAIVDVDEDTADVTAAIVDGLGRVLALAFFAVVGRALDELNT
jgi:hypothetical protein